VLRIYEINPQVRHLAESRFTYLAQCPAKVEIVMGDARLSMEAEQPQQYDVLALDAFSSDAIPVHLLTKEAVKVYLRHLKPDGVLAVHVSNRYLKLEPVVAGLAEHFKLKSAVITNDSPEKWWGNASTWVLLTHNADFLELEAIRKATDADSTNATRRVPLWTDDHTSLLGVLR
jgi:spermidine synthase